MKFASYFDHALLRPDVSVDDVKQLCKDAKNAQLASVCIPPYFVTEAKLALGKSRTRLGTVIGFPFGYSPTVAKVEEIKRAIDEGADEFDVVINIAALKSGHLNFVRADMDRIVAACHLRSKKVKLIFETALMTKEEVEQLCVVTNEIQPNFVSTSSGFNGGATLEAVKLLRGLLKPTIKIKASAHTMTVEMAKTFIDAGVDRLGTSNSIDIIK